MRHCVVATLLLLAFFNPPAAAQSPDAVVVEATRFPEDVRRLPASTTVIEAEEIARSPARTLPEFLNGQAGFTARDLYGNNAAFAALDLRGFGATGAQNTLVLVDGRRLSDLDLSSPQWSAIPLALVERIEILRGSGAVLYGDAASAGVVNIVTRSPLRRGPLGEALARVGTFDTVETRLYGSGGGEHFGINGSLYSFESDGYRANNRNEQENATLNLRWALGEGALDLRFATDRQELRLPGVRRIRPSLGIDEFASDPRGTATPNDFASRDGLRAGAELSQRLGEAELSLALDYRDKDARIFNQSFSRYQADDLSLRSISPKARVPVRLGGWTHRVTIGMDLRHWDYDSRRADVPGNVQRPANRLAIMQRTRGLYLQNIVDVTPGTTASVGLRREQADYSARDRADPGSPACSGCTAASPIDRVQRQHAWELGVRHQVTGATAVFARANRSFRFANVDEIYEFSAAASGQVFDLLRPQHARTHEVGAEWRRAGHRLRTALFQTEVSDEIRLNPITFDNVNMPPTRRRGLELDGAWQASTRLRLNGAYTYTEARFVEGVLPGTAVSIRGRAVPLVPRDKVALGALWDMAERTQLSATLIAVGEQIMENDEANTFPRRIPSYATLDAKLAHRFGWGRLALSVNNLFDRSYFAYAVNSTTTDLANVYPLPGRSVYLSAEVSLR